MTDAHTFMVFGAAIALAGLFLASSSKAGRGQTTIKLFGAEITLAAAGGIVVMLLGILTFALPTLIEAFAPRHGFTPKASAPEGDMPPPAPTDQKAVETILSNGPTSASEIGAYLSAYSGDVMRYPSVDWGGTTLVNATSNKRTIDFFFTFYTKSNTAMYNMAKITIDQQLCRTTGLRKAIALGGSARVMITDTPAPEVVGLVNNYYLDCA